MSGRAWTISLEALILAVFFCCPAHVAGEQMKMGNEPIHISSDTLEAFNDQRLVVFSGNAEAIRGDMVLRSDKLMIYYRKAEEKGRPKAVPGADAAGDLDRIVAKGRVTVTQGKRLATGDEAVFEQETQRIVMTGNTVMREGKNVIRGNKITLLLNENRGLVEAQEQKRVTATIYPNEGKGMEK